MNDLERKDKTSTLHVWVASLAVCIAAVAVLLYVFAQIFTARTEAVITELSGRVESLAVAQNVRLDTLIDRLAAMDQLNQRLRSLEAAIPYRPAQVPQDAKVAGAPSPDETAPVGLEGDGVTPGALPPAVSPVLPPDGTAPSVSAPEAVSP